MINAQWFKILQERKHHYLLKMQNICASAMKEPEPEWNLARVNEAFQIRKSDYFNVAMLLNSTERSEAIA